MIICFRICLLFVLFFFAQKWVPQVIIRLYWYIHHIETFVSKILFDVYKKKRKLFSFSFYVLVRKKVTLRIKSILALVLHNVMKKLTIDKFLLPILICPPHAEKRRMCE